MKVQKDPRGDRLFVTIPKDMVLALGIEKGDELVFSKIDKNSMRVEIMKKERGEK